MRSYTIYNSTILPDEKEEQRMQKTFIGYARVSTEDQNEARQLESFRAFSEPISKTFQDFH